MTDISKEAVDALLQGVTEGPWQHNGESRVLALFSSTGRKPYFWEILTAAPTCFASDANGTLHTASGGTKANARFTTAARELVPALRAALDEAEAALKTVLDRESAAYTRHDAALAKAEAERDALAAQLDAATALLRDGLLTVQTGRNEPLVIWSETVAAHLGAKP